MRELGPTIIEEGILQKPQKFRKTIRAIILNEDNQVLMLYSKRFNDYTFPGGGLKANENEEKALKRELKEEIGASQIKINDALGYINEIKYGLFTNESTYLQTSIYYYVDVEEIGYTKLEKREIFDDIKPVFIDIDACIIHNQNVMNDAKHQAYGLKTVLKREEIILKNIKEHIHEKI
jgi:ADP-ribose pyrophosphatase YjhB (NUDIX family)